MSVYCSQRCMKYTPKCRQLLIVLMAGFLVLDHTPSHFTISFAKQAWLLQIQKRHSLLLPQILHKEECVPLAPTLSQTFHVAGKAFTLGTVPACACSLSLPLTVFALPGSLRCGSGNKYLESECGKGERQTSWLHINWNQSPLSFKQDRIQSKDLAPCQSRKGGACLIDDSVLTSVDSIR